MPYGVNAFEIRDNQEGETGTANQAIRSVTQCYIRMENRWMEFSIGTVEETLSGEAFGTWQKSNAEQAPSSPSAPWLDLQSECCNSRRLKRKKRGLSPFKVH